MFLGSRALIGAGLVVIAAVAACSSDDGAGGAPKVEDPSDAGAVVDSAAPTPTPTNDAGLGITSAEACDTKPTGFTVKNTDYFHVFPSLEAARTALHSTKFNKLLPTANTFQTRAEASTAKLFAAFQKLYPAATEGMTEAPRVLIKDDESYNASAYGSAFYPEADGRKTAPWIFYFNKGMFVDGVTDAQIDTIAAHELGHLILRTSNEGDFAKVYYRETPEKLGRVFGEYQTNDPELQKLIESIEKAGARVGFLFNAELNGFTTTVGIKKAKDGLKAPQYERYLETVRQQYTETTLGPTACADAQKERADIVKILNAHYDPVKQALDPGTDATKLNQLTKFYEIDLGVCLGHAPKSFIDLVAMQRAVDEPGSQAQIDKIKATGTRTDLAVYLKLLKVENDFDVANPNMNIVSKLLGLGTQLQDLIRTRVADPALKYPEVRIWTGEDRADEAAVRISKIVGIDATALADGLLIQYEADDGAGCHAILNRGEVPFYGGVVDPHHPTCWRQWRNTNLAKALQTCPATWPK